jgi:transposase
MSRNAPGPHAPDDDYDTREEQDEYPPPEFAYSVPSPDIDPVTPPPEPHEPEPFEQAVDYLQLPGLRTLSDPVKGKTRVLVRAEQLRPSACPECGCRTEQFKGNGTRRQFLLDEPRGSLSVRLDLRRRSYSCRACDNSKLVPLDCLAEGRRMTQRLERYIQRKSLLRPFLEVAQETGVSPKTVREVFNEYVRALELEREERCPTPRVLGLDGVYVKSKERAILTDPERGLIVDVWPTVESKQLTAALRALPRRELVEVVTIDMSPALRLAVSNALPQAAIVVDRYHIQRMANEAVDSVRRRLRKEIKRTRGGVPMCHRKLLRKHRGQLAPDEQTQVNRYFELLPELRSAYETKEEFFAIWRAGDSAAAKVQYEAWWEAYPPEVRADFKPLGGTMKRWGKYVFNYFDHRYTNAFTEASNRRVKDIQREGRGGDYKTVRAKIIFGTLLRQELKAAREQEPGYARRQGTPRAKGPKPPSPEEAAVKALPRPLPVGLQLSLF